MSNSIDEPIEGDEQPLRVVRRQPSPKPGYGLIFSEANAQMISEFVKSPVFKMLRKTYILQARDRAARKALANAQDLKELFFNKGEASAAKLFFTDMMAVHDELVKTDRAEENSAKD